MLFADLQADEGSDRLRADPTVPLQRWRVQQFYRWAATLVRERQLDAVWDLGDTTNDRTALAHPTVQAVTRGCAELTAGLSPVYNYKLLGNHEQHLKSTATHVGDIFSPYFRVVEDRAVFTLPALHLHVICISFPVDATSVAQWLEQTVAALIARDRAQVMRIIVLGHFAVEGASLGSGNTARHGIPRSVFKGVDRVFLGHVHRRQTLFPEVGWYVGSPFQQDFGEAQDPAKCVAILDTVTLEVEWVPTPFPAYRTIPVTELAAAVHGEDVLRVTVRSPAEAQQLYASPAAGSVSPVYAFASEATEDAAPAVESLDFAGLTRAYTASAPLPGTSADELLALAGEFQ